MMDAYTPAENRYERAQGWFRRCGHSGLMLPAISLGCWHNFGDAGTDSGHNLEAEMHENVRAMLFAAFDRGITHFDLANNYGPRPGAAESRVGRILNENFRDHRDELIVSTKAGYGMWPGPYGEWGSSKYLRASLDQSLKRLQLEYVDIFYSHRFDPDTPLEETMGALDSAVRQGKAIYVGISSYSGEQTQRALEICRAQGFATPIIHQPSYSMLNRGIESDLLPVTKTAGLGVIAFCPLSSGLLTDRYLEGVPADSRGSYDSGMAERSQEELTQIRLHRLATVAKARGQSLAQMSLSWVLRDNGVTSALIGASRPAQIIENCAAAEKTAFDESELKSIESILAEPLIQLSPRPPFAST